MPPNAYDVISEIPCRAIGESEAANLDSRIRYPWFAIRVRSNFERIASTVLRHKGYEELVPYYRIKRRWSDRFKEVQLPLFPGYVFCRFDPLDWLPIIQTAGALYVVSSGRIPVPVDEREMESLHALVRSGVLARPHAFLRVGQRVVITGGPLRGVEGVLLEFKTSYRIVVSISLLQRSVAAEVEEDWVQRV